MSNIQERDAGDMIEEDVLEYARDVVVERVFQNIDGLKPVQRHILYSMHEIGAKPNTPYKKCARIVGDAMGKYHPHGDRSIYDALVMMTDENEALIAPLIDGHGSFGSCKTGEQAAAMRYTECRLSKLGSMYFKGINENAVDFESNYDNTEKEPCVLPVPFPSILVNSTDGIAVGMKSSIPNFQIKYVCNAAIEMLKGNIENYKELAGVIGYPDFATGGVIHENMNELNNLMQYGIGKFYVSANCVEKGKEIIFYNLPYGVTTQVVAEKIKQLVRDKEIRDIAEVMEATGKNMCGVNVTVKRGADVKDVISKLYRKTKLRSSVTFDLKCLIGERPVTVGVYGLLKEWIDFRMETVRRIYKHRADKKGNEVHLLKSFKITEGRIKEVADIIVNHDEDKARELMMTTFGLDEEQCTYFLNKRIASLTPDNAKKAIKELFKAQAEFDEINKVVVDEEERKRVIIKELEDIQNEFNDDRVSEVGDFVNVESEVDEKYVPSNELVAVVLTENGGLKKFKNFQMVNDFDESYDEKKFKSWIIRNDSYLLVFTKKGDVYKLFVDDIDSGRRGIKTSLSSMTNGELEESDVAFVDAAGDFSGSARIIYGRGNSTYVKYSKFSRRKQLKYRNVYPEMDDHAIITQLRDFFVITSKKKAQHYVECNDAFRPEVCSNRVARIGSGEEMLGVIDTSKIPDIEAIDFEKYDRGYPISIGKDKLW